MSNTIAGMRLCPECRHRPSPALDNPVCAECTATLQARARAGFTPRKCGTRLLCEVCGAPEGEPHEWDEHQLHDIEQEEERAREERIADMVAAKLAASTPSAVMSIEEVAQHLGISVTAAYARASRHKIPGRLPGRRAEWSRKKFFEGIHKRARS
jgi:hypothetical protein